MRVIIVIALLIALFGTSAFLLLRTRTISNNESLTSANNTIVNTDSNSKSQVKISREVTIEASEYKFVPADVKLKKGETVKIILKNVGTMQHNWMVSNMGGASIDTTNAGETSTIVLTPSQKGTFSTFCSISNHRSRGMVGKLIVE